MNIVGTTLQKIMSIYNITRFLFGWFWVFFLLHIVEHILCKDLVLIYLKQLFPTAQMSWDRMPYAYHGKEGLSSFSLLSLYNRLQYQLHNCHTT